MLTDLLWHLMRVPAAISSERPRRHHHHRDSHEDSVSKGEEKLGIRKVSLGLPLNSCEGFKNNTVFERM